MTLKEELEILRGEPIQEFVGDPMDIPCIETSDPEKLCKHPVVSVHMITYNHEPYIRQAIEGVMMQKTDFEFELVIGEDCSTDTTREICFEYQKRYPDKIRVLWWYENVSKVGGNFHRVLSRCRGEYLAFCEGDDYWMDSYKLADQIRLLKVNHADMCVANCRWQYPDYFEETDFGADALSMSRLPYFHTSTYLLVKDRYLAARDKYNKIYSWYDITILTTFVADFKVCLLSRVVSVYRITGYGIATSLSKLGKIQLQIRQFTDLYLNGSPLARPYCGDALRRLLLVICVMSARKQVMVEYSWWRIFRVYFKLVCQKSTCSMDVVVTQCLKFIKWYVLALIREFACMAIQRRCL